MSIAPAGAKPKSKLQPKCLKMNVCCKCKKGGAGAPPFLYYRTYCLVPVVFSGARRGALQAQSDVAGERAGI